MFGQLQDKFTKIFKIVKGHGKISENNIADAIRQIRIALLESDVNFKVVSKFINNVKEKSMGQQVFDSVTPGQQFIKLVLDELIIFLESENSTLNLNNNSLSKFKNIIAIASGKGGVGKSTFSSNLSIVLSKIGYKVGLIDADIFGPSIPMIFNCSYESPQFIKINNKNYMIPINQYGIKLISIGFLIPLENAVV
jgi:signal recognition particle GTPase